jgi:hypothetical protein
LIGKILLLLKNCDMAKFCWLEKYEVTQVLLTEKLEWAKFLTWKTM